MPKLQHWIRNGEGERELKEIPEYVDFQTLEERLNAITVIVPYFQQAAQVILFAKANTNTYPRSMTALRDQDDTLIATGSYDGLTEGAKAQLLITAAAAALGVTL